MPKGHNSAFKLPLANLPNKSHSHRTLFQAPAFDLVSIQNWPSGDGLAESETSVPPSPGVSHVE